jgi:hypothetical protein
MKKISCLIVFIFIMSVSNSANAAPCDGSKSAFFDTGADSTAVINESSDFTFGKEKTVVNTLGTLRQRTGSRLVFTAPGQGTETVRANILITTSQVDKSQQILQFFMGPLSDGVTSCAERAFSINIINSTANNPSKFTNADLEELGPNDGTTSYVISTDALGQVQSETQTFGAEFAFNVIPGQNYELGCGSVSESNDFQGVSYDCKITVSIAGSNGNNNGGDDGTTTPPVVEVTAEEVKVQPETRTDNCPLTAQEHLNLAIKTEQALKLRMDRQTQDLQDAIDAVSAAGVNPGPALRRLDALVEFVRDDIAETRNVSKGGLEFSKRHLACAKEKTDNSLAQSEIDQAIVNDDAAIAAIMTENSNINEESVRLKATLETSSLRIESALADKEQAGQALDESFTMPDFASDDVNDVFNEFQASLASLAKNLEEKVTNSRNIIRDNNTASAVDAILGLQVEDCINEFFDEVVQEYTKVHTALREELKEIEAAAKANADAETPDPEAPTAREAKQATRSIRRIDKTYTRTVKAVNRTKRRVSSTFNNGLVGSSQSRTEKKIRILLQLLKRAELANDRAWRRLIRRELKKIAGVSVGI